MDYKVKDISLADKGRLKIDWAESHMPVLMDIRKDFEKNKPFDGLTIAACLHVTKETAVLAETLQVGGAKVALCGSNPLSTQDDVSAALAKNGINVFAWRGVNNEEYYECVNNVLDLKPTILLDDGADLISVVHTKRKELIETVWWGQEETTTGVIRLRAMAEDGTLKFPLVAINDTPTKNMFDNIYGTGQSTIDGILRATSTLIAGKTFVVAGYGHCGYGVAARAKGMGANVVVTEVDPVKALKAVMDGFRVMPMSEAAKEGDIFVTVTGNKEVIKIEHVNLMKDGAIVANSGHFNVEIDVDKIKNSAEKSKELRDNVIEYTFENGKRIYLLAEGRLVNLAAAEGHPSSVMDMSFANHALVCEWMFEKYKNMKDKVYDVPDEINHKVASLKLKTLGISMDVLTPDQEKYLHGWEEGT